MCFMPTIAIAAIVISNWPGQRREWRERREATGKIIKTKYVLRIATCGKHEYGIYAGICALDMSI